MAIMLVVLADANALRGLSPREQRVLDAGIRGLAEKEIADQLGISEHTVREYKRRICDKTPGARTIREAAWLRGKSLIEQIAAELAGPSGRSKESL
jgi:DNA-binding CsgD family transcriptional regulator